MTHGGADAALPLKSWLQILVGIWNALSERHIGLIAAGVAFFAFFAVFPAAAALIAFWGLWADPVVIESQLEILEEFVPQEALDLLASQIDRLVEANESTLGWTTAISMLITLWSARLGVGALMQGLNAAHGAANRGGVWHLAAALALTLTLMGVAIVALASIVVLPVILAFIPLGGFAGTVVEIGRWAVAISVVVLGTSLVYRYGPNRRRRPAWFSIGLGVAVMLWAAASAGFSWFLTNFGNYNEIYGSIGAVIALLMWFYISAYAILLGAVLNAEVEAERRRQAAEGVPQSR